MEAALPSHRKDLREHAPQIEVIEIDPEKIGALIGPGGKNIRRITEVTGANIDIDDDNSGKVRVYAKDREAMKRARDEIDVVTGEIEAGKIYRGIVRGVKDFGAFVECLPGKEGLVHISELADFRVNRTEDICKLGDEIIVKCIGIDERGRVKLSRRAAMEEQEQQSAEKEEEATPATEATDDAESADAPEETAEQSGDDAATEETSSDAGADDSEEDATDDSEEEAADDSEDEAADDSEEEATDDSAEDATEDSEEETNKES
jgi:polyribonucleotide nucleotidyltransferase